jgi:hypothetical protein
MTQKATTTAGKKGNSFVRALVDLFILVLLLAGAGAFGYWFGTQQRMAPVELVPPGTAGAKSADGAPAPAPAAKEPAAVAPVTSRSTASASDSQESPEPAAAPAPKPSKPAKGHGKLKYWLMSTGSDYVGYSITVSVNGTSVDNFFGPGKTVDITRLVKKGTNDIAFDAQALEEKYNQHKGDQNYKLTVVLVGSPSVSENYKPDEVLLTYRRTAADSQNFNDTMHFVAE